MTATLTHSTTSTAAPDQRTDTELVAAHQAGDPTAAPALLARHRRWMHAVAWTVVRDHGRAEDVTQDACLRVWRALGTWEARDGASFAGWVHVVVRNTALTQLRRDRVRPATSALDTEHHALAVPDRGYGDVEDQLALRPLLDGLPESLRLAVLLVDLDDLAQDAAAAHLGVPVGTVKSRRHRGVAAMRRHYQHECDTARTAEGGAR